MARYIDADKLCEGLKSMASVQPPFKQSTILGVVSTIENTPTAEVAPKSEVAEKIIDDILEAVQGEIDTEDNLGRNAWNEGDTVEYHIHQYAEDKLDTFKIALSLYKKKYTEDQKREND